MSLDKYDPIRVLGEGSFGKVYLMRDKVRHYHPPPPHHHHH